MSLEKVKEILKQAESLTGEEKRYLAQQLLAGSPSEVDEKQRQLITQQKQMQWLAQHRAHYAGQWVALDGEQLICPGTNNREVLAQARKLGVQVPFVAYLEPLDALPFGGW
jgi:hypothetical protein